MKKKIVGKGIDESKILMLPNWVDENHIRPLPSEMSLKKKFGLSEDTKVILYSGNLGEKQGLEVIVEVANSFRSIKNLVFLIVGSGGGKDKLVNLVQESTLENVKFFPLQPYEALSALLATADIHLVLQKKSASDLVMPSKLTAILASGGCSIVTASPGTSLYETVFAHKLGILVEPENPLALKTGIEDALNSDLAQYRQNARAYSEQYLGKEHILSEFEISLKQIVTQ